MIHFTSTYTGNIGIGQQLLSLLKDLAIHPELQQYMRSNRICFDIYGSGAQLEELKSLTAIGDSPANSGPLAYIVRYRGLIPRKDVDTIYSDTDCLMLHLGRYSSLSMVIPTKIFEYAATPYPIVFGASGFTSSFINEISGTFSFLQCNARSFLAAIKRSRNAKVNLSQRKRFLDKYDSEKIYAQYASHILDTTC